MTSITPNTIGWRLRFLLADSGFSIRDFSRKSGVPYRTLQDYLADRCKPGADHLARIAAEHFDIHYILTGENRSQQFGLPVLTRNEEGMLFSIGAAGRRDIRDMDEVELANMRDLMRKRPPIVEAQGRDVLLTTEGWATYRRLSS